MNTKRINEIETRKAEIRDLIKNDESADLDALSKEVESLNAEMIEMRKKEETAKQIDNGSIVAEKKETGKVSGFDSIEYRKAFMDYVVNGKQIPAEYRSADYSKTADNAAVIPTTVLNKIVEKMEITGKILPLVNRISYPAGVSVPTSELTNEATWIAEGAEISVDAKKTANVTFNAFPLVKAIGITFKAHVQSLSVFESAIVENVSKAMIKALERAIISGDGMGKCKGIITETVDSSRKVAYKNADFKTLVSIVKAIPAAYKEGSVLVMNENTFLDFLAMTDASGQPIARVNYGISGAASYSLLGKQVVTTDYLPDADSAKTGDVVIFAYNFNNYYLNTAYDMDLQTYYEQTTRNKVYQSYMLVDGKSVDSNGLVLVTKDGAKA